MFQIDPENVSRFFLYIFPILIISVTIHEFAHCWTTDRLGDDTPRRAGRITLNPLSHLDPYGTIFMVLSGLTGFGLGWGKAAIFNPLNFRHPTRDRMLSALAGPMSNVLQMLAWGALVMLVIPLIPQHIAQFELTEVSLYGRTFLIDIPAQPVLLYLWELGLYGIIVNATLAAFNLFPVYPLDGHHILSYLAPPSWRPIIDNPLWMFVFIALVLIGPLDQAILHPYLTAAISGGISLTHWLTGWPG